MGSPASRHTLQSSCHKPCQLSIGRPWTGTISYSPVITISLTLWSQQSSAPCCPQSIMQSADCGCTHTVPTTGHLLPALFEGQLGHEAQSFPLGLLLWWKHCIKRLHCAAYKAPTLTELPSLCSGWRKTTQHRTSGSLRVQSVCLTLRDCSSNPWSNSIACIFPIPFMFT